MRADRWWSAGFLDLRATSRMTGLFTKLLGDRGERASVKFLRKAGYRILEQQCRNKFGEIDIVALDGDCIVFVEVKTRRTTAKGHPVEAITFQKQQKLTRLALAYLKERGWLERSARFDVISVLWNDGDRTPKIDHYPNAFEATGRGQMFC